MIDTLRLLAISLFQICLFIGHTSPNYGNELTSEDKPEPGGGVDGHFQRFSIMTIVVTMCPFYHLIYHSQNSLNLFETFLILIMILSFSLRMWSYYTLNKFFTFTLAIKKDHQLIKNGPYQYLVHPSYTGQLGMVYTFILFTRFYWMLPILGLYTYMLLHKRISIEENMMINKFGGEYDKYIKERKRFIPFIY